MTRLMIVCSAVFATILMNGCSAVTSARGTNTTSNDPLVPAAPAPITTWYIRNDGGTRYSSNVTSGQCDGKHDAPYPGSGANRACAFNDYRYLFTDGTTGSSFPSCGWVIAGGDTVIIRGGPWRVGYRDGNNNSSSPFGCGTGDPFNGDLNPTIPAGTSGQHTRILGEHYQNCGTSYTQLHGGYGLAVTLDLRSAAFVDAECLELTDYAQCEHSTGSPQYPASCRTSPPMDDYSSYGMMTNTGTDDILLQDMNLHGFDNAGIRGPVGGTITATRVRIAFNTNSGWNFDDGNDTASVNGQINATNLTIEWNGCDEEYPIVDTYPAISCYDDNSGGYGDGMATADTPMNLSCTRCIFRYNTQDGLDFLHSTGGSISITQSESYANMGQQFKEGAVSSASLTDSFSEGNCDRMSAPIIGAPPTFNAHLSDFCRAAGDQNTFAMISGSKLTLQHDTFVGYGATVFDIQCHDASCGTNPIPAVSFEDNIVLGYVNSKYNSGQAPGLFFFGSLMSSSNFIARDHNEVFGTRNDGCPSTGYSGEFCSDPLFVTEPTFVSEASLDHFNFNLSIGSPARNAGVVIHGQTNDYSGNPWQTPPSVGASEHQ
ncbi:MAG: hypothetical protein DMG30_01200 [Acidobacteria bacterium]|nr:MAG: hypothetical protein DMG30_01200 [Acidobacteriota bacterium]